jgi:ribose 5-phosphate isomerase B
MKIALSTDHAGFEQVSELQEFLESEGHECTYFGPEQLDPADDYPDFIIPAACAVAAKECEFGVILGRSGQGEAIAANRIKGARCAVYYGPALAVEPVDANGEISTDPYEIIRKSRMHNNSNMLSLASVYVNVDEMKKVLKLWLETPFDGGRHLQRIQKIDELS